MVRINRKNIRNSRARAYMKICIPLVLSCFFFCAGCSQNPAPKFQSFSPPPLPPVITEDYILQPYDTLEIKFFHNPELNDTVIIRPDGKITLQMVDEVSAAGLTPSQLDDLLTQKYGLLLNRVMISVIVRNFTEQKVYIGGEVYLPQVMTLNGRMNALQAIFMAGGFKPDAKISDVMIVSRGPDNKPLARKVNLKKALKGTIDFEEYRLKAFDIVYVPQSGIAGADQFISHIYSFIPPHVGFMFSYEVNDEPPDD